MKEYKNINNEELKEEFIKWFGEDKWNKEDVLAKLWPVSVELCKYLDLEPIPIVVDEIKEDSRFYPKELYITISNKLICDEVEVLKCLIHEIKHYHQYICIIQNRTNEPLLDKWKEDFKENYEKVSSYEDMLALSVEVDAYAFTKYIMKEWFEMDVLFPNIYYEEVLKIYINKYFM